MNIYTLVSLAYVQLFQQPPELGLPLELRAWPGYQLVSILNLREPVYSANS